MKRVLVFLLSLVMVIGIITSIPVSTFAASGSDLTFTLSDDRKSYSVTGCKETASGELVIPSTYRGLAVTGIGDFVFYGCENITAVTIPDSVISIGESAFEDCINIESITIPNSVTSIGSYGFEGCTNLKSLTISNCITTIEYYAFANCTSLTSIVIPESVKVIDSCAFSGCTSLASIALPANLTIIGDYAFENTAYYNDTVNWFDSVLYIDNYLIVADDEISGHCTIKEETKLIAVGAFLYRTNLTSVTIPESVSNLGSAAFCGCSGLTSIELPNSITSISKSAFESCTNLTSISIPNSVVSIGEMAFYDCSSLTSVTISNGVTDIEGGAFIGCTNLTSIIIPDSVTSIGYGAFSYCNNLRTVEFGEGIEEIDDDVFARCTSLEYAIFSQTENKDISKYFSFGYATVTSTSSVFVGTGDVITVADEDFNMEFACVVKNDVNGDGVCDVLDCAEVQRVLSGFKQLEGAYLKAGDADDNGEIDATDYQSIVNSALAG